MVFTFTIIHRKTLFLVLSVIRFRRCLYEIHKARGRRKDGQLDELWERQIRSQFRQQSCMSNIKYISLRYCVVLDRVLRPRAEVWVRIPAVTRLFLDLCFCQILRGVVCE
jgi:hypothetical protein